MVKPLFGTATITIKRWPPSVPEATPLALGQKPGFDCWREDAKLRVKGNGFNSIQEAREAARLAQKLEDEQKGWVG